MLDALKADVTAALTGTLRDGTLWRATEGDDGYGNPVTGPPTQVSTLQGLRATYDAQWLQAGIPSTDVRIEMLAASLSTAPVQTDKVNIESAWWVITAVEVDPSGAWYSCQCKLTSAP